MTDKEKSAISKCVILLICSISVSFFSSFVWNVGDQSIAIKCVSSIGVVGMWLLFAVKAIEWMKIKCTK